MLRSPTVPGEDDNESTSTTKSSKTHVHAWHATRYDMHSHSPNRSPSPGAIASSSHKHHSVDYLSLSEALQGESPSFEEENREGSTDSVLDRESIELASSDGVAGGDDDDDQVGSETLLEILGGQGDLEQRMDAIEALESSHDDHGTDNTLDVPTYIRVMYMGAASEKDKRLLFRKLSRALATVFNHHDSSLLRNPNVFKERKHHILLMSLLPEDGEEDIVETCEDNGLSIIEADFTWSTVSADQDDKLNAMIAHYLWLQCEDPWTATTSTAATDNGIIPKPSPTEKFDGFVYPEKTPNGIDLCVYFYDCSIPNPVEDDRVEEDLAVLWQLKRQAIPIIPILSGGRRGSRSSASSSSWHPSSFSRSVADRRSQLAELLAQYKIRCIDISRSNLDIGRPPSFQRGEGFRPMMNHANLEKRLGKEWATSSVTTPAPYNILTVDQFSVLDRRILFNILKQSRQRALKKERVLKAIRSHHPSTSTPVANTTTTPTTITNAWPNHSPVVFVVCLLLSLLLLPLAIFLAQGWSSPHQLVSTHPSPWTATVILSVTNLSLLIARQDQAYNVTIPLPVCLPSTGTPVSLASLVLDHPPQVDVAINQEQLTCTSSDIPFPLPPQRPPTPTPSDLAAAAAAAPGPWENLRRTTTFLFRRPKKFFTIMWERGRGK